MSLLKILSKKTFFLIVIFIYSLSINAYAHTVEKSTSDDPNTCDLTVIVPSDITICASTEISLDGAINGAFDEFVWCQDGIETSFGLDEDVTVSDNSTFTLKASFLSDDNIIVNGDFESGDSNFTTDYFPGQGTCNHGAGFLGCEGAYNVIDDPGLGHNNFASCSDNGSGGNMMVVNGASSLQQIWCQDVCVDPDGSYVFNAFAASVNPGSPARLQFAIDGTLIGNLFGLTPSTCIWEFFEAEWDADGETTVEICVTNQNTAAGGNDFALDDIGFFEVCKDEMSFDVIVNEFEIETFNPEDIDCNNPEIEVEIEVIPSDNYTIEWTTQDGNIIDVIDDGEIILVSSAGEYFVTVTDANGCSQEEEIEVFSDVRPFTIDVVIEDMLDCNNPTIDIFADSDNNNLVFEWFDDFNQLLSSQDIFEVTAPGLYSVVATDLDTGCPMTEFFEIMQDTISPIFIISKSSDIDCNAASVFLQLDIISNNVMWMVPPNYPTTTPVSNTSTLEAVVPGNYIATVENDNGCTASQSITVTEIIPDLQYSVIADGLITCDNRSASISITADTSLLRLDWNNLAEVYNDSLNFSLSEAGTFLFSLTDSIGCAVTDSIIIRTDTIPPLPLSIQTDEISCTQPTITLTAINPNNYDILWENENGVTGTGENYNVSQAGTVTVQYTSLNGCTRQDEVEITASDDIPNISVSGSTLSCDSTSVTISITSDKPLNSYNWSNSTLNAIPGTTAITVSEADTYSVNVISDAGCTANAEIEITIDTIKPLVQLPMDMDIDCNNTTIADTAEVDPDFQELLFSGDWFTESNMAISISDAGTYTLEVIGQNGCSNSDSLIVGIDTIPISIDILSDSLLNCNTDVIEASFSANGIIESFEWTTPSSQELDSLLTITTEGTYSLSAIGTNGCESIDSIVVNEDMVEPRINVNASTINCAFPMSTIILDSPDSLVSITYTDINGDIIGTDAIIETSITDTITVEVIALNGCTMIEQIIVPTDLDNFTFDISAETITCDRPEVEIQLEQNLSFVSATIFDSQNNEIGDISTLISVPGMYTVQLTLANGCESRSDINIVEDTDIIPFSVDDLMLNCQLQAQGISIDINSNFTRIEVLDVNQNIIGDQNSEISELGTYTVIAYNENGCPSIETFEVTQTMDRPNIANISSTTLICEEALNVSINMISGGVAPYIVSIDGNIISNLNDILVEGAGIHDIRIEDSNNCALDTSIFIDAIIPITIEPIEDIIIEVGESAQLQLELNKDLSEISEIVWRSADFLSCTDCIDPIFSGTNDMSYEVSVIDINGCMASTIVNIEVQQELRYYVPNVISLNGSSNNVDSRFTIFSSDSDIRIIQDLLIYDRWGNKVFENSDFPHNEPTMGWDGTFKQKAVEQGVYVYYAVIELIDGEIVQIAGDLTVLK